MSAPPELSLFDEVCAENLRWSEPPGEARLEPGNHCLFQDGISTRGLEVSYEEGALHLRILAASCPEEYELALAVAENAARREGTRVLTEDGDELGADDLRRVHDGAWVKDQVEGSISATVAIMQKDREVRLVQMSGPHRPVMIGRRLFEELNLFMPEGRTERVFDVMRRVQYVDETRYAPAHVFEIGQVEPILVTAVLPEKGTVLSKVDEVVLKDCDCVLRIKRAEFLAVDGVSWHWLDEEHVQVEPIMSADWGRVFADACAAPSAKVLAVDAEGEYDDGEQRQQLLEGRLALLVNASFVVLPALALLTGYVLPAYAYLLVLPVLALSLVVERATGLIPNRLVLASVLALGVHTFVLGTTLWVTFSALLLCVPSYLLFTRRMVGGGFVKMSFVVGGCLGPIGAAAALVSIVAAVLLALATVKREVMGSTLLAIGVISAVLVYELPSLQRLLGG